MEIGFVVVPTAIIILIISLYFWEKRRFEKLREKATFFEDKGW